MCEFIEDCEYPQLIVRVVHLLGEEGAETSQPSKIVRYIYNRLVLENVRVRIACIDALTKIGVKQSNVAGGVVKIIEPLCEDPDDETRDAAVIALSLLKPKSSNPDRSLMTDFERSFDFEYLESQLMEYIQSGDHSTPFDMSRVPALSRDEVYANAEVEKSLEQLVPAAAIASPTADSASSRRFGLTAAELTAIPAFTDYGSVLKSSMPLRLTDNDAEYSVAVVKHWFERHLVLEYIVTNTVSELLLKAVKVSLDGIDPSDSFHPTCLIAIPQLDYDSGPASAMVSMQYALSNRPTVTLSSSLRFKVFECDPDTKEPYSQNGSDETFALPPFDITFADYVIAEPGVPDFDTAWNAASVGPMAAEMSETFCLTALSTMPEAVSAIVDAFGAAPIGNTDRVDPYSNQHTLLLSGSMLYPPGRFLCRCRLSVTPTTGCTLELTVRSAAGRSVCEAVMEAVC